MIRLSVIGEEKPIVVKLVEDAVAGTAGDDEEVNKQLLREKLEAARVIVKERMKQAAASMLVQSTGTDRVLVEKMHRLKLEVLSVQPVLAQLYRDCVLDEKNRILTDEEFWGCDEGSGRTYGYTALTALVERSGDLNLQSMWARSTTTRRKATEAAAAAGEALLPGRATSLLSDNCMSVNPLNGEIRFQVTPEVVDHIFLMCKCRPLLCVLCFVFCFQSTARPDQT